MTPSVATGVSRSLKHFLEWVLLPGLAALTPWNLCFQLYRWLCLSPRLFREETASLVAAAAQARPDLDPRRLARDIRLVQLLDRADIYLARFRSDRWMDRHLEVHGDPWPEAPFVAVFFHYGMGLWAIRHLCRDGRRAAFLSAPAGPAAFGRDRLRYLMARWRLREVARAGRMPVVYTGGSMPKARRVLQDGNILVGAIDTPPAHTRGKPMRATLLGETAWFPGGLLRLAREANVPLAVFTVDADHRGNYRLVIRRIEADSDQARLDQIIAVLDERLQAKPACWHFWHLQPLFRQQPTS